MTSTSLREVPPVHEPRSVVSRAFAVLEAFTPQCTSLSLSEISRRARTPLTTTHRLVHELEEWGALEREEAGTYRIGIRLWEVASLASRAVGLREAALPFLEDLYEVTHENVQVAVRDGSDALFVERIAGRHAVNVRTRVGGRFPLHASGAGLVLLAFAPAEVQAQVLAAPLARFTAKTIVDPNRLRRALAEVRRSGLAVSDGQVTLDSLSIAAPVFDGKGEVTAAVSIVVATARCDPSALAPLVRAASLGISRALRRVGQRRRPG